MYYPISLFKFLHVFTPFNKVFPSSTHSYSCQVRIKQSSYIQYTIANLFRKEQFAPQQIYQWGQTPMVKKDFAWRYICSANAIYFATLNAICFIKIKRDMIQIPLLPKTRSALPNISHACIYRSHQGLSQIPPGIYIATKRKTLQMQCLSFCSGSDQLSRAASRQVS